MVVSQTLLLPRPDRSVAQAMRRGFLQRCPRCDRRTLFRAYLKVVDRCPSCDEALCHQRADDAPPYVVMMIVGHLLIAGMAFVDDLWSPPGWVHAAIWIPLAIVMSLAMLPRVKGAIIGLQWANRMHGFGDS